MTLRCPLGSLPQIAKTKFLYAVYRNFALSSSNVKLEGWINWWKPRQKKRFQYWRTKCWKKECCVTHPFTIIQFSIWGTSLQQRHSNPVLMVWHLSQVHHVLTSSSLLPTRVMNIPRLFHIFAQFALFFKCPSIPMRWLFFPKTAAKI